MPDDSEPEDLGGDHDVPADLVELHEILEYALAVDVADRPES